ncbi:MAG: DUF2782 domain-containing protein [Proteobacteria bacterium]|nr:DUF2782 domain-containing protein [Pseudomonadota bacterium]HQR05153.1 DUF2782 domain-containing protein [Rhodocyclaceae bacterium]
MRLSRLLPVLAALATLPALAADRPAGLIPVPDVPPPPAATNLDQGGDLEPQVTITQREGDKVEEYRVNGQLYMIKVTPPNGIPYYLMDDDGKGDWIRRDSLGTHLKPPMWVIHRF